MPGKSPGIFIPETLGAAFAHHRSILKVELSA
jgi:hypothetical protein